MPKKLRIKRRKTGAAGPPDNLANAEIAFNEVSAVCYYGKGGTDAAASEIIAIGGSGAFVALVGAQTVAGAKTFTGAVVFDVISPLAPTPATNDSSTKVATTAFVKNQQYLTSSSRIDGGVLIAPGSAANLLITTESGQPIYTEILGALSIEE